MTFAAPHCYRVYISACGYCCHCHHMMEEDHLGRRKKSSSIIYWALISEPFPCVIRLKHATSISNCLLACSSIKTHTHTRARACLIIQPVACLKFCFLNMEINAQFHSCITTTWCLPVQPWCEFQSACNLFWSWQYKLASRTRFVFPLTNDVSGWHVSCAF